MYALKTFEYDIFYEIKLWVVNFPFNIEFTVNYKEYIYFNFLILFLEYFQNRDFLYIYSSTKLIFRVHMDSEDGIPDQEDIFRIDSKEVKKIKPIGSGVLLRLKLQAFVPL